MTFEKNVKMRDDSYIKACPIGCRVPFSESGIRLPEGPLMKCSACGQLFLPGDEAHYAASISGFDVSGGTCPDGNISKRLLARTLKTMRRAERLTGKNRTALKALDVGCSSGGPISFFNPGSMRLLAERAGFTCERINYHSVSLFKQEDVSPALYRTGKIIAEFLNLPSKLMGKSHEIEVYLRAL